MNPRAWPPGAQLRRERVYPDALEPAVVSVAAYQLRNRLQRECGQLRRLLDGADLTDPAIRRRVRLRVASMVEALLDGEATIGTEE